MKSRYQIPPGQSVTFDLIRIFATFAVVVQHATAPSYFFDQGQIAMLGRTVIPVFLMISGYMTAATMSRGGSFHKKVARRYLKYYFVVIPAFFILLAADIWLVHVGSPIVDEYKFEGAYDAWALAREFFQAITYSGEYWRENTVSQGLFGNVAFWTVDYILAYVALTTALFMLDGVKRWVWLAICAAIAGPTIVLLSPLWFAGVWAFELHRKCDVSRRFANSARPELASGWPVLLRRWAWAYLLVGALIIWIVERQGVGQTAYLESKSWASYDYRQSLGMAKRFAWQWLLTPGLFFIMLASKYVIKWRPSEGLKQWARKAALYTLPIYIFHFSFLYVVHALIPNYQPYWYAPDPYIMIFGALLLTIIVAWAAYRYVQPAFDRVIARII